MRKYARPFSLSQRVLEELDSVVGAGESRSGCLHLAISRAARNPQLIVDAFARRTLREDPDPRAYDLAPKRIAFTSDDKIDMFLDSLILATNLPVEAVVLLVIEAFIYSRKQKKVD